MDPRYMSRDSEVMGGALCFKAHVFLCKTFLTILQEPPRLRSSCKTFHLCLEKLQ